MSLSLLDSNILSRRGQWRIRTAEDEGERTKTCPSRTRECVHRSMLSCSSYYRRPSPSPCRKANLYSRNASTSTSKQVSIGLHPYSNVLVVGALHHFDPCRVSGTPCCKTSNHPHLLPLSLSSCEMLIIHVNWLPIENPTRAYALYNMYTKITLRIPVR